MTDAVHDEIRELADWLGLDVAGLAGDRRQPTASTISSPVKATVPRSAQSSARYVKVPGAARAGGAGRGRDDRRRPVAANVLPSGRGATTG